MPGQVEAGLSGTDPVKAAAFRNAFSGLTSDEQNACLSRLTGGLSYAQIASDLGDSAPEARRIVTGALDRLLRSVFATASPPSARLADLLGCETPAPGDPVASDGLVDMTREEEALLHELFVLAQTQPPPKNWGKFTDLEEIGSGGFGTVYGATDPVLQTRMALKLYHAHRSQRPADELLSEARKLARIRHPNVVSVHGADEIDGRVGVWMELVEGQTLDAEVRDGRRLDGEEAADVGMALCQALEAVHAAGVVHGDIKAQNVVRGTDGRIVLMDFGAARFRDSSGLDTDGARAGTPAYMAPELFAFGDGTLAEPTVQSDVYAVGVLLFYLVAGTYPVDGNGMVDYRKAHARGEQMRRLADERPDLSESFARVVEQSLARSPDRRWLSVGEMHRELLASKPRSDPAFNAKRVWRAAKAIAGISLAFVVLGFLETRVLEVVMNVPPAFGLSPVVYFGAGAAALVPYIARWLFAAFGLGLLLGMIHVGRRAFKGRLEPLWARWSSRLDALDAKTTAASVLLVGVVALTAITWTFYDPIVRPIVALLGPADASTDLAAFDLALRRVHQRWDTYVAGLSFLLGIASWTWFPRLERRVGDAATVRLIRLATIGVAFIAVAMTMTPRGLLWESFEIAEYQGKEMYVLRSAENEYLLYDPEGSDSTLQRVHDRHPEFRLTGFSRALVQRGGMPRPVESDGTP